MTIFVVAYSIVWLALGVYVARIGVGQRRLSRLADELRSRVAQERIEARRQSD